MDATCPESPPPATTEEPVADDAASRETSQIREREVPADESGGRAGGALDWGWAEVVLDKIESKANEKDNEAAHAYQDALFEEALRRIADAGCPCCSSLAAVAYKARSMKFTRWYA